MPVFVVKGDLVVAGSHTLLVGEQPDLEELDFLIAILIVFAVRDAGTGAHHLDVSMLDDGYIAHAVFVLQVTVQWNGNDLHIIMWMGAKASCGSDLIVIEDAKDPKVHPFRVMVIGKTKSVAAMEPPGCVVSPRPV